MKEKLQETINKFLINSYYDSRMTLTENQTKFLFEANIGAQSLIDVRSALGELGSVKTLFKLGMTEARMLKLLSMDAETFIKEIKKAIALDLKSGVGVGVIGPKAKELSKMNTIREITNETKLKGRQLTISEIDAIKNSSKLELTQLSREVSESTIKAAEKRAAKLAKDAGKTVADDVKNLGGVTSFRAKFANITTWKGFKDALKKWGLVAVLSAAALYALWAYFFPDKPVPENDETVTTTETKKSCPAETNTGVVYKYEYPGDSMYVYGIKGTGNDAKWYAKNRKTGLEFNIHDCYPETAKKLNAVHVEIKPKKEEPNKESGKPNVVVTKPDNGVQPEVDTQPEVGADAESLGGVNDDTNTLN